MSIKEDIKGLRAKQYKVIVGKTLCHFMESSVYSKASSYAVFGFRKKTCILRLIKNPKIRVPQVFLEPFQNRLAARSAHLEVAYLEALLYKSRPSVCIFFISRSLFLAQTRLQRSRLEPHSRKKQYFCHHY